MVNIPTDNNICIIMILSYLVTVIFPQSNNFHILIFVNVVFLPKYFFLKYVFLKNVWIQFGNNLHSD